ncbi:MAG: tRNA pseudouridine synthase A [Myxococcales bacterium]|nr:tRNA pseudouridine synthase A [Myxococcales bacterium]
MTEGDVEPGARSVASGVLLTVAYDGGGYAGYAPQPGQATIAGALLAAVQSVDPAVTEVRGASRTDAGVHARGQRVAFDTRRDLGPRAWVLALARALPATIAVRAASLVPAGLHPRFAARRKHYRYLLLASPVRDPHWEGRAWRLAGLASGRALGLMQRELAAAVGTHAFGAFRSSADTRAAVERTIDLALVRPVADGHGGGALRAGQGDRHAALVAIDIVGTAFLHRMVRILVGTAVDVARDRLARGAIARALASGDRRDAGVTAPAHGLYLESVELALAAGDSWP